MERWQSISSPPYGLRPSDRIRVRPASTLRVEFEDGSWLDASNEAQFTLAADAEEVRTLWLYQGTVDLNVRRSGQKITEVKTPAAATHLREDRVVLTVDQRKATFLRVIEGLARVTPATGDPLDLQRGYVLYILKDKEPGLPLQAEAYAELEKKGLIWPGQPVRVQKRSKESGTPVLNPRGVDRPTPALGAAALGLPAPKAPPAPPRRPGVDVPLQAVDPGPTLGVQSLGLKLRDTPEAKAPVPRSPRPPGRKSAAPAADLKPLIGP